MKRRRRKLKVKTMKSQTIICVNGRQSLHVRTEKVGRRRRGRRGRRRKRKRRKKNRRKRRRRGRKRRRKKRKRKTKRRKQKRKRKKRKKRKRKGRSKRKKKGRKKKPVKMRRYKRHTGGDFVFHSPEIMPLLNIYSVGDENAQLLRTYFVTDCTVIGRNLVAEGSNPSLTELRSVVETIDGGLRGEAVNRSTDVGHSISKRSTKRVRCYRVMNFGRRESGRRQYLGGSRSLAHRGELSASVIENADVHVGALLRVSRQRSWGRRPTVVLGNDGRTLRCTAWMMHRADPVGEHCRAVVRCEHGGRWTRVGRRRYRCRCPFGYGGPRCAHRAVRCAPGQSPCRNGGTCMEMPPSRRRRGRRRPRPNRCFCPHHFAGRFCQRRRRSALIKCSSKPCRGGARCRDLPRRRGFFCSCPKGRSGRRCQHRRSDVCQPDGRGPCRHNGRCLSTGGGSYFCLCSRNHGGKHCQLPLGSVSACPRSFCHYRGRHYL